VFLVVVPVNVTLAIESPASLIQPDVDADNTQVGHMYGKNISFKVSDILTGVVPRFFHECIPPTVIGVTHIGVRDPPLPHSEHDAKIHPVSPRPSEYISCVTHHVVLLLSLVLMTNCQSLVPQSLSTISASMVLYKKYLVY